jgi:hypothetical protein
MSQATSAGFTFHNDIGRVRRWGRPWCRSGHQGQDSRICGLLLEVEVEPQGDDGAEVRLTSDGEQLGDSLVKGGQVRADLGRAPKVTCDVEMTDDGDESSTSRTRSSFTSA